jgi:coenzyme F420-reducing hydrogenase delta subunit
VEHTKKLLEPLGVEPERVKMYNLSASDGPLFAEYAKEFTEIILGLGPIYEISEAVNE